MREIESTRAWMRKLSGDVAKGERFAVWDERDKEDRRLVQASDAEDAAESWIRWRHDQADYVDRLTVHVVPVDADGTPCGDEEVFTCTAELVTHFSARRRP